MWLEKRYHSLDYEMKSRYGQKLYKLALDGGFTCPNRDGTLDTRGCIFCSAGGSGDFAADRRLTITEQIEQAKMRLSGKQTGSLYIAYFQAYTGTYAPVEYLRSVYEEAIRNPDIAILSIATRPDCLPPDVLDLLEELNAVKPVWVELGLQTIHPQTAECIRRGYPLSVFDQAVAALTARGIEVIVHVILGLPGAAADDMLATVRYIAQMPISGIKFQLLHVLKGTDLCTDYQKQLFHVLSLEEYTDILIRCIELLPPHIVIHRLTGDGPRSILEAPEWSLNKKYVLNSIHHSMKTRDTWQGKFDCTSFSK
ncbi:MAG: TIGR01212 family radical SAM protein [Lachnospiraceae bacterium]|nr:TIGR01212 family radical SAM protein [Lachnospiraceae bacterium]